MGGRSAAGVGWLQTFVGQGRWKRTREPHRQSDWRSGVSFLYTDNFMRDYEFFKMKGVKFVREPSEETYGKVAVFADLYGNLIDLIEPRTPDVSA